MAMDDTGGTDGQTSGDCDSLNGATVNSSGGDQANSSESEDDAFSDECHCSGIGELVRTMIVCTAEATHRLLRGAGPRD